MRTLSVGCCDGISIVGNTVEGTCWTMSSREVSLLKWLVAEACAADLPPPPTIRRQDPFLRFTVIPPGFFLCSETLASATKKIRSFVDSTVTCVDGRNAKGLQRGTHTRRFSWGVIEFRARWCREIVPRTRRNGRKRNLDNELILIARQPRRIVPAATRFQPERIVCDSMHTRLGLIDYVSAGPFFVGEITFGDFDRITFPVRLGFVPSVSGKPEKGCFEPSCVYDIQPFRFPVSCKV